MSRASAQRSGIAAARAAGSAHPVDRLLGLPELAVTMAKAHFRGYARPSALGDLSETDGDLSAIVRDTEDFRQRFAGF